MHFQSSQPPKLLMLHGFAIVHAGPISASEDRYSDFQNRSRRAWHPVHALLPGTISGRGPSGRRSRPELQALSNSLQFTSI
jgi:hypothetical protein